MNKSSAVLVRLCLGLLIVPLLASCASQPAEKTGTGKKAKDEEYVYRTSIVSRIPVKVRKSEAQTSEESTKRDQRWLSRSAGEWRPTPERSQRRALNPGLPATLRRGVAHFPFRFGLRP